MQKIYGITLQNLFVPIEIRFVGKNEIYNSAPIRYESCLLPINFDPARDTFTYLLIASRVSNKFSLPLEYPALFTVLTFTNTRITMLYRIFNQPPPKQTISLGIQTSRTLGPIRRFAWWEICNMFNDIALFYSKGDSLFANKVT